MSRPSLLEPIVRLRLAIAQTRYPALRDELRQIEASLRGQVDPFVAKREAADLLGVSVTALDRWVDRGRIPVVARPGLSRLAVETTPLLELAVEVERLRRHGVRRGRLARALERLGRHDSPDGREVLRADVAALPRPNVPARELKRQFEETTPEERVLQLAALNRSLNFVLQAKRA
ncbi:MAG: hypothetical protein M3168_01215 [Actinomycetota bacterium]|nr:hypothetical protein [Actinomycetota bacterium]